MKTLKNTSQIQWVQEPAPLYAMSISIGVDFSVCPKLQSCTSFTVCGAYKQTKQQ